MAGDFDTLIDMGFPENKVKKALADTGNSGLQPAMDWLIAHADDSDDVEESQTATKEDNSKEGEDEGVIEEPTANSLKCEDCNRLLRNTDAAQFHAAKTGHQNFSQSTEIIKPLTEEEKKQKLEEIKQKLAEKRTERMAAEALEQREREKMRRITGRDISDAKEKQKEMEMKKAFEQKKREQEEEKIARARVKAQIEADKKARAEKAEREKAIREGKSLNASTESLPSAVQATTIGSVSKDYQEARIQIRPTTGPSMTQSFPADSALQKLIDYLEQEKGYRSGAFTLSTTFPRKTFTSQDYSKSFKELGLVPSAALILTGSARQV